MSTVIGNPNDFKIGDNIRYVYRGFSISRFNGAVGSVLKINKKSVKIKIVWNGEIEIFNVNPIEIYKNDSTRN